MRSVTKRTSVTVMILFFMLAVILIWMMRYRRIKGISKEFEPGTTIIHLAREYDPLISYGGMGSVIGSITRLQAQVADQECIVVLPKYSFLEMINEEKDKIDEIAIQYDGKSTIGMNYSIHLVPIYHYLHEKTRLIFIGSSYGTIFDHVWETNLQKLYMTGQGISTSMRECYFNLVAAKFVEKFVKSHDKRQVYVHVHGSTNGLFVYQFLKNFNETIRPPIVYTMHDYNSEPVCRNILIQWTIITHEHVKKFEIDLPDKFLSDDTVSLSRIGIIYADFVTCVSKNMREDLISGRSFFTYRNDLIAKGESFLGVQNAVSETMQPSVNVDLKKHRVGYKPGSSITGWKADIRNFLIVNRIINFENDLPIILFVGRFEFEKGVDYLPYIATLADKLDFNLLIMGYHSHFGNQLKQMILPLKTMRNVRVVESRSIQKEYGMLLRAVSDFGIVLSRREGYGLVAAESQAIGAIPIVSDVGGLRDIVLPFAADTLWTGFQFELNLEDQKRTEKNIGLSISKALAYFKASDVNSRDAKLKYIMEKSPKWQESVDEYAVVYSHALNQIRSQIRS